MSKDIRSKKQKIINEINKNGSIDKLNKKETKPFQQNTDVLLAYEDNDVVFTYNGQRYTQGQLKEKFDKINFFMKLDKKVKLQNNRIVKTLLNDTIEVLTLPNKANNSPKKSRRIPRDYVIIKYDKEAGAVAVPKSIFFTNPIAVKRINALFPDWREYEHNKFSPQEKCDMVRYLADTPEFKGDTKKKYKSFGNEDFRRLLKMTDNDILNLEKEIDALHIKEVAKEKLEIKDNKTVDDIDKIEELESLIRGENERIKKSYKLSNRGTLTDLRVWFTLMSTGKNPVYTINSKSEAVYVIPKSMAYKMLHRITSLAPSQVWEQV